MNWSDSIAGTDPVVAGGLFAIGLLLGLLLHYLFSRPARHRLEKQIIELNARADTQAAVAAERETALSRAEERLAASFGKLADEAMSRQSDILLRLATERLGKHQQQAKAELSERERAIAELIKPIQQALDQTREQISVIEKTRLEAFGNIRNQLEAMATGQETLRSETQQLVKALRRPEVRGQWGEITLRRIVELAGMVEHCDFTEQAHTPTDNGAIRPDLIIHLPDRGQVVVDVKTPLDAYLEAVDADTDEARRAALQRHARNVASRVRELSAKAYWAQFERSPEMVILFIPGDQFLSAALSENPALLEEAMSKRVILATPTSLVALLKAIAYGWRQLALADNAEEIRRLAVDLYSRLGTFSGHMLKLGKQLNSGVAAYNQAVGSLERMVLPGARKFTELGVQATEEIPEVPEIEKTVRQLTGDGDPAGPGEDDSSKPH